MNSIDKNVIYDEHIIVHGNMIHDNIDVIQTDTVKPIVASSTVTEIEILCSDLDFAHVQEG